MAKKPQSNAERELVAKVHLLLVSCARDAHARSSIASPPYRRGQRIVVRDTRSLLVPLADPSDRWRDSELRDSSLASCPTTYRSKQLPASSSIGPLQAHYLRFDTKAC